MSAPVVVEVAITAPPDRVWRALRDPGEIFRWHGWEWDPGALEDEIRVIYLEDVTESPEDYVLETGGGRFELEPTRDGSGTVVRIRRDPPAGADDWSGIADPVNEGWLSFAEQLRFYLERAADTYRRTLYLDAGELDVADLGGEEWFRSERQHGVVLEDGRTLVIHAADKLIVSAYGAGEDELETLRARLG